MRSTGREQWAPRRILAIATVGILATSLLTACSQSVSEIRSWLKGQEMVAALEESGGYNGFTYLPNFVVRLQAGAGDDAVRSFAHDVGGLLNSKNPGKTVSVELRQDGISFEVSRERSTTDEVVTEWIAVRADDRVHSGGIAEGSVWLETEQQLIADVYRDHASDGFTHRVSAGDAYLEAFDSSDDGQACAWGGAAGSAAIDLAETLLAEESYLFQSLNVCTEFVVGVASSSEVLAHAESLRLRLESFGSELPPVKVLLSGAQNQFQLLVTGASAGELRALSQVHSLPGVAALERTAEGIVAATSSTAALRELLEALAQHPDAAELSGISIRYASNGTDTRDSISSASIAGAIFQLSAVESVLAEGRGLSWVASSDTEFRVHIGEQDYSSGFAEQLARVVYDTGVASERTVIFGVPLTSSSVEVVGGHVTETKGRTDGLLARAEQLGAYWESLVR